MDNNTAPIECVFPTEEALYLAYIPFLMDGGLFIRSKLGAATEVNIGENIMLSVTLPNESEPMSIQAKVVWVTPVGVKGNKPPGFGVMFVNDEKGLVKSKIEKCLGALITSGKSTDIL